MSLNDTPSGERVHIGFFGLRNAGKSSVVNAFTGQDIAVVSDVSGTTTDPVFKSMELLPMGPVMIIDTPGIDDEGELGEMRVARTKKILGEIDVAVLVVDSARGLSSIDKALISEFEERKINHVTVFNKSDLNFGKISVGDGEICVSAKTGEGINALKELIAHLSPRNENECPLVGDLVNQGDTVILVTPIDSAAPKGRLILPQQQVIRGLLEGGAISAVCRETELENTLKALSHNPKLVITDSQAFSFVSSVVPESISLTSFSILFARYKGTLASAVHGVAKLDKLSDGSKILISEGCTHHRQCGDIGSDKLPKWIHEYTGKAFKFEFSSGTGFPDDVSGYDLVLHCGGCMLNAAEMGRRSGICERCGTPMTNYGITIAQIKGILRRSISLFPDITAILDGKE